MSARLPLLLTGYGLPYTCGYIRLRDGSANPRPWTPVDLVEAADRVGLSGIEVPLSTRVPSFEGLTVTMPSYVESLREALGQRGMTAAVDFGVLATQSLDDLRQCLRDAHRVGAKVVRAILSDVLCGDRRTVPEGWPERLEASATRLRDALPLAADLGLCIAVENHQDATTEDLWWLHGRATASRTSLGNSAARAALGVTLDTGNPLAVGQDPVEACRSLAPILRHVHLKDYRLHSAPEGYRLVRCAAGEGVVNFRAILRTLKECGTQPQLAIEQAAQSARTIPLLDPGWWTTFPARPATALLPLLEMLGSRSRPVGEDYRTPWEAGADGAAVIVDEWRTLVRGVEFFTTLPEVALWNAAS